MYIVVCAADYFHVDLVNFKMRTFRSMLITSNLDVSAYVSMSGSGMEDLNLGTGVWAHENHMQCFD